MKIAKDIFFIVLGGLIAVGTFVLIIFLIVYRPEMSSIIDMSVGALIAAFSMVVGYFYGSSKGSSDKNEMLMKK